MRSYNIGVSELYLRHPFISHHYLQAWSSPTVSSTALFTSLFTALSTVLSSCLSMIYSAIVDTIPSRVPSDKSYDIVNPSASLAARPIESPSELNFTSPCIVDFGAERSYFDETCREISPPFDQHNTTTDPYY